jgi:anti-sigma B factor antagonist
VGLEEEHVGHRAAIDSTEQEGVRVIAVRGDVDITRAGELQTQLRDAVWGFDGDVLIEVDDAHFIDASTLSRLARASLRVRRHGRRLGLVGASESVRRVMAIARLTDVLPAYDTMAEAMADLGAAR